MASQPIRILHLITGLNTGGSEMALMRLLQGVDRAQFEMFVVCLIPLGPVGEQIQALGFPVTSLDMPPGRPTWRGFRQLIQIIRQFQPNILQTWLYHADLLGLLAAKWTHLPTLIWNIRSAEMDFSKYPRLSGLVVRACALFSKLPNAIVVNSRTGQTVHTQLGYHPRHWVFIPNGIDTQQFTPNLRGEKLRQDWGCLPDETVIGLVGRLDPMKDHPNFLQAIKIVAEQVPTTRFVCVGAGLPEYRAELEQLAEFLGLRRLVWAGPCTEMPAVYNALDILVSSSKGEGFPNVVAEAMACGRPCIVTQVGDSALIVGETGLSVPPQDPQALANAILKMLELPETERTRLGQQARQRIQENFSPEKMLSAYSTLYTSFSLNRPDRQRP